MPDLRTAPRNPDARKFPARVGFFVSLALLGCTPYGNELDDTLVAPSDEEIEAIEADTLEPIYEPLPDDDEPGALVVDESDPRCSGDPPSDQAWELDDPQARPQGGQLEVHKEGKVLALPLRKTRFDTVVVGTVAETEVVQVFTNPFDEAIEAIYMFPLHEHAAVDDYWLTIGDRTIRGQMKTREDARATYEDAKREGRAAGLLEQERPNIFTQNVANIPPGESIEVSVHLVQPLEQSKGNYSLVLPTVVGPRFIPGADAVPDASRVTAPILPDGAVTCAELEVSVAIETGMRARGLRSRFHDIDIRREGDVAFIELDDEAERLVANRDFVLSWDLGQHQPQAAIVAQANSDQSGGYFTLTVQPPVQVADEDALARELIFVVDNSGSMGGRPMDTAKGLMQAALAGMRPDDSFNVLRFSEAASGLAPAPLPANADNRAAGQAYVREMEGMGGTHMLSGIEAALGMDHDDQRMRLVMFLTDGFIGNEHEIFEVIERDIGDARLFALGVGGSTNRFLLDGMARVGRGYVSYPDYEQDIDAAVAEFYERIETPVLSDIEIDWQGLAVAEVLPGKIPDLFAGQPLTVFGKYEGQPSGEIVVRARGASGKLVELPVRFEMATAEDFEGVSSVWARSKIDELLSYPMRSSNRSIDDDLEQAVVDLALQYRVMTEYTSFVAVDEQRIVNPDGTVRTVVQPLPVPEGTSAANFGEGTIALGSTGLIGKGGGGGVGSGYGRGAGAGFGGRGKRVPQVRQAKAAVQGSLDKDIIRRIVRAHINEVRSCYNQALTKDPNVGGKVTIQFEIGPEGKVSSASVQTNGTGDTTLGTCVAKMVKRWTFPKPPGGGSVSVAYPFNLSPG